MADISYTKTTWVNGSTALNAANLNNIEMGVDNATKAVNTKVDKVAGKGLSTHDFNDHYKNTIDNLQGEGGISVIKLTDKNGTIASTQLGEINANPQNFAFKYNGKILLFTSADSTTYQYCNNTTSSSDNNVMTTSTLLTITSSTGAYTIAEKVHNVVANSIHPANGGDLTNIQVGSKVYSIPSGGGNFKQLYVHNIRISLDTTFRWLQLTLDNNEPIDNLEKLINALKIYVNDISGASIPCSGHTSDGETIVGLYYNNKYLISYITLQYDSSKTYIGYRNTNLYSEYKIADTIIIPRQTV